MSRPGPRTHPPTPRPLVRDVMLTHPSTLPATTTVDVARSALERDHVHLLLLVDGATLRGTLTRSDLARAGHGGGAAMDLASVEGRTVSPTDDALAARERMRRAGVRRLAVVDGRGDLLGLLCLKHHGRGFCSEDDVEARRASASHP